MKQTVEEAARDAIHAHYKYPCGERDYYEHCNGHNTAFDCCECGADEFKEGFISGAQWQSKQSPWISVKERLPEKDGYYFVTNGDVVEKVYFFERWNKFTSTRDYPHLFYDEGEIKAWLHIPSFDEILESNRDVLERIKEKGD